MQRQCARTAIPSGAEESELFCVQSGVTTGNDTAICDIDLM